MISMKSISAIMKFSQLIQAFIRALVLISLITKTKSAPVLQNQTAVDGTKTIETLSIHIEYTADSERKRTISNSETYDSVSENITWNKCGELARYTPIKLKDEETETDSSGGWHYYNLLDHTWDKTDLTYSVHKYAARFPHDQTDAVLKMALKYWSDVTTLTFTQLVDNAETADLKLYFVDHVPLDQTMACTYIKGEHFGRIEFIENINWTVNNPFGVNAVLVAVHEFGHALGLDHSDVTTAIMYATAPAAGVTYFELDQDDIDGIQALYGKNPTTVESPQLSNAIYDPINGHWYKMVYDFAVDGHVKHVYDGTKFVRY